MAISPILQGHLYIGPLSQLTGFGLGVGRGGDIDPSAMVPGTGYLANSGGNVSYLSSFIAAPTGQPSGGLLANLGGLLTHLPDIFGSSTTTARTPTTLPAPKGTPGDISTIPTTKAPTMRMPTGARGTAIGLGAAAAGVALAIAGHHYTKAGKLVKNRRMNPCNGRALRRALRRAYAFEHFAKKVVHLVSPKKHVRGFRNVRRVPARRKKHA